MGSTWGYLLAFAIGVAANWGFRMLSSLLGTQVHWKVVPARCERVIDATLVITHCVSFRIQVPRWKGLFISPPIAEALSIEVQLVDPMNLSAVAPSPLEWIPSMWVNGDVRTAKVRADGATRELAQIGQEYMGNFYVADSYPNNRNVLRTGTHVGRVRVLRVESGEAAVEAALTVRNYNGVVVMDVK